jgi:hypothetical protein
MAPTQVPPAASPATPMAPTQEPPAASPATPVRPDHHRSAYGRGPAYEVHKRFIYNRLERNTLVDEKLPLILQYVSA